MSSTEALNSCTKHCTYFCYPFAALDWGGPRREWFELICKTLFDTSNQLFTRFSDNNQGLVSFLFIFLNKFHVHFS